MGRCRIWQGKELPRAIEMKLPGSFHQTDLEEPVVTSRCLTLSEGGSLSLAVWEPVALAVRWPRSSFLPYLIDGLGHKPLMLLPRISVSGAGEAVMLFPEREKFFHVSALASRSPVLGPQIETPSTRNIVFALLLTSSLVK